MAAEATIEVVDPPTVAALYFWALQVSFTDRGRRFGGAHLGLQWHPDHPGSTAVNWGGYRVGGGELSGSESPLPSASGNPNTRDLRWEPGVPYGLRIERSTRPAPDGTTAWQATVTAPGGAPKLIRDLWAGGAEVSEPIVWAEVFADCDAPSTAVGWSELSVLDGSGARHPVRAVRTSYQPVREGGCRLTDSSVEHGRWIQRTGVERRHPPGTELVLPN